MVDVDRPDEPAALVAGLPALGWRRSVHGGSHIYIDAPPSETARYTRLLGGDPAFARMSRRRGWCGDRPAPPSSLHALPRVLDGPRADWWRALVQAHRIAMKFTYHRREKP